MNKQAGPWYPVAQALLEEYASREASRQRAAHVKKGRKASTFRYAPTDLQRDLIGEHVGLVRPLRREV